MKFADILKNSIYRTQISSLKKKKKLVEHENVFSAWRNVSKKTTIFGL